MNRSEKTLVILGDVSNFLIQKQYGLIGFGEVLSELNLDLQVCMCLVLKSNDLLFKDRDKFLLLKDELLFNSFLIENILFVVELLAHRTHYIIRIQINSGAIEFQAQYKIINSDIAF